MKTIAYPLRIPKEIIELSRLKAQEQRLDQSTALRQLLYIGAEEYALSLVAEGRISIGKASEMLNTTVYDMQIIAKKHGIELGPTKEQAEKSRENMKKTFKKNP